MTTSLQSDEKLLNEHCLKKRFHSRVLPLKSIQIIKYVTLSLVGTRLNCFAGLRFTIDFH
jgi:hypothetical protein